MLEMKPACEACGKQLPQAEGGAQVCSFECTWCDACAAGFDDGCPNCHGELVQRPRRRLG